MAGNKPNIKSQDQIAREQIKPYNNPDTNTEIKAGPAVDRSKERANQRTLKGDDTKTLQIGIRDLDESIHYYFNEVLRPRVTQNGQEINVPLVYGSPERWSAMQKDGFYRDKNGMMQAPLIVFRRTSIEKNRSLGNKMDANSPHNVGIFKKSFSRKNAYDRFSAINNRKPVEEYYKVAIPDYVNITYDCVIYTDYLNQNNKIVEAINFASDSYWGDPSKFRFRATIDNYTTSTELVQGNDRINKTNFSIQLLGHIITDQINTAAFNNAKLYSKSSVKFGLESEGSLSD